MKVERVLGGEWEGVLEVEREFEGVMGNGVEGGVVEVVWVGLVGEIGGGVNGWWMVGGWEGVLVGEVVRGGGERGDGVFDGGGGEGVRVGLGEE